MLKQDLPQPARLDWKKIHEIKPSALRQIPNRKYNGSMAWYLYGAVMTIGAGGDLTILLKLLRYRPKDKKVIYLDHPTECGLICFEK